MAGSSSRVEQNHVSANATGLLVLGTGHLVIRNSASGNGVDFDIAPGNAAGSIVEAGQVATDTSPHANFRH